MLSGKDSDKMATKKEEYGAAFLAALDELTGTRNFMYAERKRFRLMDRDAVVKWAQSIGYELTQAARSRNAGDVARLFYGRMINANERLNAVCCAGELSLMSLALVSS